jgi:Cof subfamily protein (haloacid dehalogenase superfamily)
MPGIKLLLADVDGTLVTKDKILTQRAIAAVENLRRRDILFAITSGRPPKGMQMLIAPLGITTPIAGFNGGAWVNPDLSPIESHTLPNDIAEKTVDIILNSGLDVWVYTPGEWFIRDKDAPHVAREEWTVKFAPKTTKDFSQALENAIKIVGVSDDLALVEKTEGQVQDALGDTASAARSQPYYLDVTHPQANKGAALAFLAKRLGLQEESIATIGDQPNDTLMFRRSGLSIAMGNASEAVQKQATHVTTASEEDGFANAVERYIIGAENG